MDVRSQSGNQNDEHSSEDDTRKEAAGVFVPMQQPETFQKLNEQYVHNMRQKFTKTYKGNQQFPVDAVWYKKEELESFVSTHALFRISGEVIRKRKQTYETLLARAGSTKTTSVESKLHLGSLHDNVLRKRKKKTQGSAEPSPRGKKRKKKTCSKTKSTTKGPSKKSKNKKQPRLKNKKRPNETNKEQQGKATKRKRSRKHVRARQEEAQRVVDSKARTLVDMWHNNKKRNDEPGIVSLLHN